LHALPEERQGHQGSLRDELLARARGALGAIEAARQRIDDLNVYPVPDGDTGTNLTLSVRAIVEALEASPADDREPLANEVARAALLGARGNSGVILSQIIRGAAESFAESDDLARALRRASDTAYGQVGKPVEGTMLTAIRELAEEAEAGADVDAIIARGDDCVVRTREMLPTLREAGVVDAGAAGLVELVRGFAGRGVEAGGPPQTVPLEAVGHELSRFRFCTSFVVEGEELDAGALQGELEQLGDSILVVGSPTALRIHVHTDEPERAVSFGRARGAVELVEIADMHEQIVARTNRLEQAACGVVAVADGAGNRRLFESLGARVVDGEPSPSPRELLAVIEDDDAREAIVLPNDRNALLAAEHAADHASKPTRVLPTRTIQAGLSALVAFDPGLGAAENLQAMQAAADAVVAGAVHVRDGRWTGVVDGERVAEGSSFDEVVQPVLERLLAEPRGLLTLLTGAEPPPLDGLVAELASTRPGLEVEVHEGGQTGYALFLGAE
jgi:DAK2 domain fusion protein YloV